VTFLPLFMHIAVCLFICGGTAIELYIHHFGLSSVLPICCSLCNVMVFNSCA